MYIYLIANSLTGKYYVGRHKGNNLRKYLQTKLSNARRKPGGSSHLFASMRKYPKEVWSIHPLVSTLTTVEQLNHWETFFIALFKSRDRKHGYNICRGGEGFTGTFSPESRRKMSEAHKRRLQSDPDSIMRCLAIGWGHMKGKRHTDEAKRKNSAAHKGTTPWMKGRRHTEESKQKNAAAHRGVEQSDATKLKRSIAWFGDKNPNYGKSISLEQRKQISATKRKDNPSPRAVYMRAYRERRLEKLQNVQTS